MTPIEPCASDRPASRWIPCSERLPDIDPASGWGAEVLVSDGDWVGLAVRWEVGDVTRWSVGDDSEPLEKFTHWMPLPLPPA